MISIKTETTIYVIFFHHIDFVDYINRTILGKPLDIRICVPALTEVKPPHRIFLNLECIINYLQQKVCFWEYLSDENKDDIIINFLIININHETLHKVIFETPEISYFLEKMSYILNDATVAGMERIIAKMG